MRKDKMKKSMSTLYHLILDHGAFLNNLLF